MAASAHRQVTADLVGLSQDARAKFPAVKEAAERALMKLRAVTASETLRVPELLTPHLLVLMNPASPADMSLSALSCLQRLIAVDAVVPGDEIGILHAIQAQCSSKSQAKLKALQILPMLLGRLDYHITAEFIRISTNLLLSLTRETDESLYRSSKATLHQIVSLLFERANHIETKRKGSDVARQQGSSSEGALLLLQDLSLSAANRQVKWLECTCSSTLALQLLHTAVLEQAGLFAESPEFQAVLLHRVLPAVAGIVSSSSNFATLVHAFRLLRTVAIRVGASCVQCLSGALPCLTDVIEQGAHMACAAPPAGSPLGQPASSKRTKTAHSASSPATGSASAAAPSGVMRHRYGAAGARILKGAHKALGDSPVEGPAAPADASKDDNIVSLVELPAFKLCLALECAGGILARADVTRSAFAQHDLIAASPARASERQAAPILEPLARALGQLTVCCFASVPIHSVLVGAAEGPSIQGQGGDASLADEVAEGLPPNLRQDDEQHEAVMLKFGYMYGRLTPQALELAWAAFQRFSFLDSPEVRPAASAMLHSLAGYRNAHGVVDSSSRFPPAAVLRQLSDAMSEALAEPVGGSAASSVVRRRSSSGGEHDADGTMHDSSLGALAGRAGAGAFSFTQRMREMVGGGTSVQRPQDYTAKCPIHVAELDTAAAVGASGTFSLAHAVVLALRCLQAVAYACDTQVATAAQRSASKDEAARSAAATSLTDKLSVEPSANPEMQAAVAAAQAGRSQAALRVNTGKGGADASGAGEQPVSEMIESVWRPILVSFASTLAVSSDPLLLQSVLRASQSFAASCGSLSLVSARDAFLVGLCNSSMPLWQPTGGFERYLKSAGGLWGRHSSSRAARLAVRTAVAKVHHRRGLLAEKHAVVFKTLFNMTHCLGNILGRSWLVVLDTVAQFYRFLGELPGVTVGRRSGAPTQWERLMQAMRDTPTSELLEAGLFQASSSELPPSASLQFATSPRLVASQAPMGLSGSQFTLSASPSSSAQAEDLADDMGILFSAMGSLFSATGDLSGDSFQHVLRALMDLSLASLADEAARSSLEAVHDVGTVMAGDKAGGAAGGWLSRGQQLMARMRGGQAASASAGKGETVVSPPPLLPVTQGSGELPEPLGQGKTPVTSSGGDAELATPTAVESPSQAMQAVAVSPVAAPSPTSSPAKGSASRRHMKEGRAVLPPFSLVRLVEVLMYNLHRCAKWWGVVSPILNALAQNPSAKVRQFAVSAHTHLMCACLLQPSSADTAVPHVQLLEPIAVFLSCPFQETRVLAVGALTTLVQGSGRQLSLPSHPGQCTTQDGVRWSDAGWSNLLYLLVRVVDSCAGHCEGVRAEALLPDSARTDTSQDTAAPVVGGIFPGASALQCSMARISVGCDDPHAASVGVRAGGSLVPAVGRLVNQICDEHLASLDAETICHVVIVLTALCRQSVDVNTALTATATLWTVTDVVGRTMAAAQQSQDRSRVPDSHTVLSGQPMGLIWDLWRVLALALRFVVCTDTRSDAAAGRAEFAGLGLLSPAPAIYATPSIRYDVRNAAVQTLFNSLSSHGSAMPSGVLQELLSTVCLPLTYDITLRANWYASSEHQHESAPNAASAVSPGLSVKGEVLGMSNGRAVRARVHHSGDSLVKQWNDARVMALQGLTKVIAASFDNIVVLDWFHDVFSFVLALVERAVTGRRLPTARSSTRTASTASAEDTPTPNALHTASSDAPTWWDYLLGDGDDASDAKSSSSVASAATGAKPATGNDGKGCSTPKRSEASTDHSASDSVLLEPDSVSVAAIACLQELALLVCVPAGVAVDVAADGYAVGMRVIDGALVHTDSVTESDAAKGRSPAAAVAAPSADAGHNKHVARSVLWADVFAALNAVIESHSIVALESDKVAVAAVACIQHVLVAYSPAATVLTDDDKPLPDTFMLSARFSPVIHMLHTVMHRRLSARWARSNSSWCPPGGAAGIPEDLRSPRVEVALGSERATIKALDRVSHVLHSHCCALWGDSAVLGDAAPSRLLLSCRGQPQGNAAPFASMVQQAVASASADYLSVLVCIAGMRESEYYPPLADIGAVALLPGAVQYAALGQLLAVLRSAQKPCIPRHVRRQLSSHILTVLTAASRWFRAMLGQLQGHTLSGDAPAAADAPPSLTDIISGMGRSLEDCGMLSVDASAAGEVDFLFPLQVWGLGAGGSYSTASAIVADARKAQRFMKKVAAHEQVISDCLVAFAEWAVAGPDTTAPSPECELALGSLQRQSRAWSPHTTPAASGPGDSGAHSTMKPHSEAESPLPAAAADSSSSLQSLQSLLGVPQAEHYGAAARALRSAVPADLSISSPGDAAPMCSVQAAAVARLLAAEAGEAAAAPAIGMTSAAVSAALKDTAGETQDCWHLLYILAAASLCPAGVLSGMPVSTAQLDASFAAAVGLARLSSHSAPPLATLSMHLLLQRCAMFVATGRFDVPSILQVALAAGGGFDASLPYPSSDGFVLLALLLRAGAERSAVAALAQLLAQHAIQNE